MRIKAIHIDGYGIFRDFSLEDLSPELNIFFGNNEAGKTTLMHFINCILFGFDRSTARDFHAPLKGGTHGGRLVLSTDSAGELVVKRHTDKRISAPPVVTTIGGTTLPETAFSVLLGNLSKQSYTQYFSFGLDELGGLAESELQSGLYSAGYTGRGRSLPEVEKVLEKKMGELWKPGGRKNRLKQLFSQLEALEVQIEELKQRPEEYARLQEELFEVEREISALETKVEELNRQRLHYQNLAELWPTWLELQEINLRVEQRSESAPDQSVITQYAEKITALYLGLDSFLELLSVYQGYKQELTGAVDRVNRSLEELGMNWSPEEALAFPTDIVTEQEIRRLAKELGQAEEEVRSKKEAVARQQEVVAERRKPVERLEEDLAESGEVETDLDPAAVKSLTLEAEELLQRQAGITADLALLEKEQEFLEREKAAQRQVQQGGGRFGAYLPWGAVLAGGLIALVAGLWPLALVFILGGLVGLWFVIGRGSRKENIAQMQSIQAKEAELLQRQESLEAERGKIAVRLGELAQVLPVEGEILDHRSLQEARDFLVKLEEAARLRRELKRARQDLADSESLLRQKEEELAEAQGLLAQKQAEWQSYLTRLGVSPLLDGEGVASFLSSVRAVQGEIRRQEEIRAKLVQAKSQLETTKSEVNRILTALGKTEVSEYSAVAEAVSRLREEVTSAQELQDLYTERERLVANIAVRMGLAEAKFGEVQRVYSGLDEAKIETERDKWQREYQGTTKHLDELKAQLGRIQERISALEVDDRLAALRLEYNLKLEEVQRGAREWAKYALIRYALDKAKERYEREKQPEVMAKASQYFERVTQGRYRRVVKPIDQEGIYVERANRERLNPEELSRGTVEELYLCLRLALAQKFSRDAEALPLIMDDILVNMDAERFKEACALIGQVAQEQQVLFFTCHRWVAEALQAEALDSRLIELAAGSLASGEPAQGELPFTG
ncbi:MAG: AAA family ATPase [Firmicutes bacterium]|nr:AAA family ATPase [Bacillota bacterium]